MSKKRTRKSAPGHRPPPKRAKHGPQPKPPAVLLGELARSLNACHKAGLRVCLAHNVVWTRHGIILSPWQGDPRWSVRPQDDLGMWGWDDI